MSLRLDDALAEQVGLVAIVRGESVSDVIRAAIMARLDELKGNAQFREAVQRYLDRQRAILLDDGSKVSRG
jgi:Arc/MetJ-type ribon-helix-helix transcriptional regulator